MPQEGKRYVITGGVRDGYGEAITRQLHSDGHSVFASFEAADRNKAETFAKELKGLTVTEVDHADRASLDRFLAGIPEGPIHGLVNGAFFFEMENPDDFDHNLWDRSLAVNLTAPNFLIHSLKRRFASTASVVTITSTEGFIGSFGASAYAATKAAIHNLTKTHANNLGARGVRVNAVAAGWIGGVMDTDEVFNRSRAITPLGRLGSAAEIASVVRFLLSDDSSFVTGTVLVADGGYTGVDTISKYEFEASKPK